MSANGTKVPDSPIRELELTRFFDAPRERVFRAWLDPQALGAWWGPFGMHCPVNEWDPRPGGAIKVVMQDTKGGRYAMGGSYREIVEPSRIVLTTQALAGGKAILENLVTVDFEDLKPGTRMRVKVQVLFAADQAKRHLQGMAQGWSESLDRLCAQVPGDRAPYTQVRDFKAPRQRVYQAFTEPAEIIRWMAPPGAEVLKSERDERGVHHYGLRMQGHEQWGTQTRLLSEAPSLWVAIQCFSNADGAVAPSPMHPDWPLRILVTVRFEELGPADTRITLTWRPLDAEERSFAAFDGSRGSLDGGFQGMFGALEAYLASQPA